MSAFQLFRAVRLKIAYDRHYGDALRRKHRNRPRYMQRRRYQDHLAPATAETPSQTAPCHCRRQINRRLARALAGAVRPAGGFDS